jgi:hypothetical protein
MLYPSELRGHERILSGRNRFVFSAQVMIWNVVL